MGGKYGLRLRHRRRYVPRKIDQALIKNEDFRLNTIKTATFFKKIIDENIIHDLLFGLDIGCGDALVEYFLLKNSKICEMMGIELSKQVAKVANLNTKINKNVKFSLILANGEVLPFRDSLFDFIICWHVIEHTAMPDKMFREIKRVLKSGGIIILSTPNRMALADTFHRIFDKIIWSEIEHISSLSFHELLIKIRLVSLKVKRIWFDGIFIPVFLLFLSKFFPKVALIFRRNLSFLIRMDNKLGGLFPHLASNFTFICQKNSDFLYELVSEVSHMDMKSSLDDVV